MVSSEVVSSPTEELILVDELDREIGQGAKSECHAGNGILHRAFSVFIFNSRNELLLQRRSAEKPLWPNYWSNTCCSHPRVGESMGEAVNRRLAQELGIECSLTFYTNSNTTLDMEQSEQSMSIVGVTLDIMTATSI